MDSLVTIVAPVRQAHLTQLERLIDGLGNPADSKVRAGLDIEDDDGAGTHFMSLHAIPDDQSEDAWLVFEFTADGDPRAAIDRIVSAIGPTLEPVFAAARDWEARTGLADWLDAHRITVGAGLFANPGLCFAGTPGMSVARIRKEAALAGFVAPLVGDGRPSLRPLDRLAAVRAAVAASPEHRWALEAPPPPAREGRPMPGVPALVGELAWPFIRTYLWPAALILLATFAIAWPVTRDLGRAAMLTLLALGMLVPAILMWLGGTYLGLRRQEARDWTDARAPARDTLKEMGRRENHCAQNHMVSVTTRKPGMVRWFTLRIAFWLISMLATRVYRAGFLGDISTIHAARWITIPGTRKLVFLSNFGGSWESYLEDFITRAHGGLTAVWSNTIGFPRAKNLFQDGATDGERFKRYARASMQPTRFWYSAYPDLTTDHVRCNAAMRRGLSAALTNDEAAQWLALFGSAMRPEEKLETMEIQSLVFGGLGFMPHGACLLYRLPDEEVKARAFLAGILPHIAFGDGRRLRRRAVLTVALGGGALAKLGLPGECVNGFAPAFLEGMSEENRARLLGDTGADAPSAWEWSDARHDLALLAYGKDAAAIARLEAVVTAHAGAAGMAPPHRVPLAEVVKPVKEPFGFVDGVSQPVIRGTYQSFRNNDPIHLVEPGEFIIGYPDNRGNLPPEPELSPLADPGNVLPIAERSRAFANSIVDAPRALARNGSYLVIRQLEQDVTGFWDYCWSESRRLSPRMPPPYDVRPDFIAAKLVGRWRDGTSLARNPYYPMPKQESESARPPTNPTGATAIQSTAARNPRGDNDFLFGVEDPEALRCPFGAHIRRANPRDSLMPGSMEQVSISNRHRIYRLGRLYAPQEGRNPGLLFICLNGDIERQFEFIQQTWLVSPAFHGLTGEQDPLTSSGSADATGYLMPSHDGPVRMKPLPKFVTTLGGGYYFMPGRSLLAWFGGR
jgi:deferrochelatase/peroxidase EfeB